MRNLVAGRVVAACVVAACLTLAATSARADSSVPSAGGGGSPVLASLERTACFGRCPIYSVTVLRDGTVQWEGKRFVKKIGKASAKLSAATLASLVDAFKRADYFALEERYVAMHETDKPSVNTSFDDGTRKKRIEHYRGDSSAPDALDLLEARIDELVGSAKWIGRDQR